jgi:hypothetical protein
MAVPLLPRDFSPHRWWGCGVRKYHSRIQFRPLPPRYSKVPKVFDLDRADPLYPANQERKYPPSVDIIGQVCTYQVEYFWHLTVTHLFLGADYSSLW